MGATLAELAHRCYGELRGDPDHEITRIATLETAGPNDINLIQIAHNEYVGEDTAMAACVGIAGSTRLGKRCTFAGQVGVVEHIEIADDVHITGATVVLHTIRIAGTYSSGTPLETYSNWLKNATHMRQLDDMARRLKKLEKKLSVLAEGGNVEE